MLEKNNDYVEFTLQYTSVDWSRHSVHPEVSLNGYSDFDFPGVPIMDVVCKEFDHKVVVVSKRDFERLQAAADINAAIAKEWEKNYDLLLKKIGFDTVEELVTYLDSEAECDTLREAIASLEYSVKFARDELRDLSKKLEECEKDYISERDKAEAIQTENEELKKKLHEFDHIRDYKELLEKLYSKEDVEKLEWTLNHVCGGQDSVNGWMVSSKLWRQNYETLSKLVGFSSVEEIQDYLTNEAECDTLREAILKLKDQVKYTCDEWYSANSRNNSWKAAAECNSPKELIEKREALEKGIRVYSRALTEWKEGTGCPSPSAAKTLIESGMSYEYAYHEEQKENRKLTEEVDSWKNVTGYSTPEDYMHARINCATPFDYTAAWQNFTGCDCAQEAGVKINNLCDEICKLKGDYDRLLKLTGYKSEQDIRVALNYSEQFVYETMRELINSLKRKAKFTESNWEKVTGFSTPEKCSSYIDTLEKKLEDIKGLIEED